MKTSLIVLGVLAALGAAIAFLGAMMVLLAVAVVIALFAVVAGMAGVFSILHAFLPVAKVPVSYTFRNLQVRWRTSLVTAVAFVVVILLLVVMLAFVRGMYSATQGTGHPGNVIALADGATDEAFSNLPANVSIAELPSEVQRQVAKDGNDFLAVKEVYVVVSQKLPNPEPDGPRHRFLQMRGIDNPRLASKVHQIDLQPGGKWFATTGVREVVLGEGIARTLGKDLGKEIVQVGEVVKIGPQSWTVTGIMNSAGSSFGSEVWASSKPVQENFGRRDSYSSFVVRTADAETAKRASELLKKTSSGYTLTALPETEYYAKMAETTQQYFYTFVFVALWMGVGGTLGVMTTMFAAISNRAKDIGVLRLLGFKRGQILMSFLFEALVIAFVGGAVGCLLGCLVNGISATGVVGGAGGGGKSIALELTVDATILAAAMLFALLMGSVGGLIPSLSAMRLKPLESLR